MINHWGKCAAIFVSLVCAGCGGPVLQAEPEINPARLDGGFIEYFFPRGEVTVTADYTEKSGLLAIQIEPKIVPDFGEKHRIFYTHAGLSKDVVNIQLENNGLLKTVSSTTTDQTFQLAQGINAILAQTSATAAAARADLGPRSADENQRKKFTFPDCASDLRTIKVVDITNREPISNTVATFAPCEIRITVTPHVPDIEPIKSLNVRFTPKPGEAFSKPICDEVICFRLSGAYRIDVEACLFKGKKEVTAINAPRRPQVCVKKTAEFLAPTPHRVGFIRFNRRAFVDNTTEASFNNGMLTGIKSSDPSELVGFLSIPSEILKGFAILIAL